MLIECYMSVARRGFEMSGTEISAPYELSSVLNSWVLGFALALPNLQHSAPWGMDEGDLAVDMLDSPSLK